MAGDGEAALLVIQDARCKGGLPLGTSKKRKRDHSIAFLAAKNEITIEYKKDMVN